MNARGIPPAIWPAVVLAGGGGTPVISWLKGTLVLPWMGIPLPRSGVSPGTVDQSLGYPQKGHGTSVSIMGWRWGKDKQSENITFPILWMRAVKKT